MKSSDMQQISQLVDRFRAGDISALARMLSIVERDDQTRRLIFDRLYPIQNQPIILGITGSAGVGKSSLINQLLFVLRKKVNSIAVLSIDPSSRYSGGALLGDRVRMREHTEDKGVFIRSMADQGRSGGIGTTARDAVPVLAAFGFDIIIIETVGTGQSDSQIIHLSDLVLVVLTPGFGDDIQAMKAGVLEIGDIFIVNKSDLHGAQQVERQIVESLALSEYKEKVKSKVCATVATDGTGIPELSDIIFHQYHKLNKDGTIAERRYRRIESHIMGILRDRILEVVSPDLEKKIGNIRKSNQQMNPYVFVDELFEMIFPKREK